MMIAPVNQGYPDVQLIAKIFSGIQSGKASANNNYMFRHTFQLFVLTF